MTKKKQRKPQNKNKNNIPLLLAFVFILLAAVTFYIVVPKDQSIYFNKSKPLQSYEEIIKFTKEGELTFTDKDGEYKVKIEIELAENKADRENGLMNRESMEELQGMLFIYPDEAKSSIWMRNTLISLDIIFVSSKFEIVNLYKNAQTLSDKSYPSGKKALYVIEVNAGFTDKYNIKQGDKIVWRKI